MVEKVLAERQVVASIAAGGGYEGTLPSVDLLDKMLGLVEETPMDPEMAELRSALGIPA